MLTNILKDNTRSFHRIRKSPDSVQDISTETRLGKRLKKKGDVDILDHLEDNSSEVSIESYTFAK
jgi:hypothetical protein